ncbi:MAG: lamin tail domain-containing protein [Spartobacteria bacterium]|nr:lamin tail domain-containing protein [Spartobacteria bacterium]
MKTKPALLCVIFSLLACTVPAFAQSLIWIEDFNDPAIDGKGAYGGVGLTNIVDMAGVTNFTIDVSEADLAAADDYWKVTGQEFVGTDLDGTTVWQSVSVDISGYTDVSLLVDMAASSGLESDDFLGFSYMLDGGGEVVVTNVFGNFDPFTVEAPEINGTGVVVVMRAANNAGSEFHSFDNVTVSTAPSNVVPSIAPIGAKQTLENSPLIFAVLAADLIDEDEVTLWASNLPVGATFPTVTNAVEVTNTFTWATPTPVGVYTTTFWAADVDGTTSETILIEVLALPGETTLMINEVYLNPPGTDDKREYLEIRGAPNASLAGFALVNIEGDDAAGSVDSVQDLNALSLGANGLLILGTDYTTTPPWTIPGDTAVADLSGGTIENGAITFMLVSNFTGSVDDVLDTDHDGVLDVRPWDEVFDSVGWTDGGALDAVYSQSVLTQSSGTPDAATRFPTNNFTRTALAWYNGDISDVDDITYLTNAASANLPVGGKLTPGAPNYPTPDQPPLLAPIGNKLAVESNALSFVVSAADVIDGDEITLWAEDIPAGATFATVTNAVGVTNTFNWAVPTPVGVYTTTFYAADADGTNSETITITVNELTVETLLISEMCDPQAGYATSRYVEIYNAGDVAVDLTGWELRDYINGEEGSGAAHVWALSGAIASGEALVCGDIENPYADFTIDWSSSSWNGGADDGALLYNGVTLVDFAVGLAFADDSLIRTQTVCAPSMAFVSDEWYTMDAPEINEGGSTPGTHVCDCPGAVDQPPQIAPIGNKVTSESNTLSFIVIATETVDGDEITLWAEDLPAGATFATVTNAVGVTNTFNWTVPTPVGVYTTKFYAADIDGTNSETITITVNAVVENTVIISEMCDPANNYQTNRYIEIYNAGDLPINLTGWELRDYINGSEGSGDTRVWALSGTIASGDALVCGKTGNASADFTIDWASSSWNGGADDGAVLYNGVTLVDFAVGLAFADDSLIRTQTVCDPVTAFVADEWYTVAVTDIGTGGSTPGVHACDCPGGGDPDTDGDGMPDWWELKYFGDATSTNTPDGDYDQDGSINIHEYIADTVPTNNLSFYESLITNMTSVAGQVLDLLAGPPTSVDRVYDAFWSTNLTDPVTWTPFNANVPGLPSADAVVITVTNEGAASRFYRTGVKLP